MYVSIYLSILEDLYCNVLISENERGNEARESCLEAKREKAESIQSPILKDN